MTPSDWFKRWVELHDLELPSEKGESRKRLDYHRTLERMLVPKDALVLGENPSDARAVYYSPEDLNTHLHVIGWTGRGKTNFLKVLAKELLDKHGRAGEGLAVIDPHGNLAPYVLDLCVLRGVDFADNVVYFDLKEEEKIALFNPLRREYGVPTVSKAFVEAITKLEGKEGILASPLISEVLHKTVQALLYNDLSLAEASFFTRHTPENEKVREQLLEAVPQKELVDWWKELAGLPPHQKRDQTAHAARRFDYLLDVPTVKRIVGQREDGIDLAEIMDRGQIAIFDLSTAGTQVPDQTQQLLGALLVQEFRALTNRREVDVSRPFHLIIDEFELFVSADVMRVFTETRKFGLRCIFAHQGLSQMLLEEGDSRLLDRVLAIDQKVVFGGGTSDDHMLLAGQVFGDHLNLDKRKLEIWRTAFEPILKKEILRSRGSTTAIVAGTSAGQGMTSDEQGEVGRSEHTTQSSSDSQSDAEGWSEAYITAHKKFRELSSVQFESFQEQVARKMQQLKRQDTGRCTVSRMGEEPQACQVPLAETPAVTDEERRAFLERVYGKPYYLTPDEADRRIEARRQKLLQSGSEATGPTEFDPEDVWEEDEL